MLNPCQFHDLVSGRRRGLGAAIARFGLRAAEVPYALAVRWRNRRYDSGAATIHRVGVPVVSVGNLTLGGTGKTPMVEWIVRRLRAAGLRVAVVSRGYGAEAGGRNDEALALEQNLPDVPHVQDADRVAAAERAIEEFACQVIVLDDAFQHRRIARDMNIVLLDALEPFGFGHVFPRGTLREPPEGLRRAHLVALSRADMVGPEDRDEIRRRVRHYAPDAAWAEAVHAPRALLGADGQEQPPESLAGKPVAAFCGIGNPAGFRHTLEACGYRVAAWREFPDHHRYGPGDVASLRTWAEGLGVAAAVCTQKDLVKLDAGSWGGPPLRAVAIGLEFLAGQAVLEAKLAGLANTDCPSGT